MSNSIQQLTAVATMAFAVSAAIVGQRGSPVRAVGVEPAAWASEIEAGGDHLGTAELAERLLARADSLVLIDVRPRDEFAALHLPGAVNLSLSELLGESGRALLDRSRDRLVVLYSNGMTHPGQAWVELASAGYTNVRMLEDGLDGFLARELMPASLVAGPAWLAADPASGAADPAGSSAESRAALRALVFGQEAPAKAQAAQTAKPEHAVLASDPKVLSAPTIVSTTWLEAHGAEVVLLDTREKPERFAEGHVPNSLHCPVTSLRTTRGDVPDELMLAPDLAKRFGELGIDGETPVVVYADEKLQDATQVLLALVALGHERVAVLEGGHSAWRAEGRARSTTPRAPAPKTYTPNLARAPFAVELARVAETSRSGSAKILDVRPADAFRGDKVTEARGGHIPGSCNRPYTEDIVTDAGTWWKPLDELERAYTSLGFAKDDEIIVTCRTGHQASLEWFTLRYVLGYRNVRWYDGSFKEWAARSELAVEVGEGELR
ncbi:MAG: hypothetical protein HZA52_21255 [Planctomycetes bacterium]|nr:hypothetical protein [Planctomycetota bacterium]